VVDYAITLLAFGICIVYACFVGDTFGSLLKGLGLPGALANREGSIIGVTVSVLFPLVLLRVSPLGWILTFEAVMPLCARH
jgi:amino acid permease